MKAGLSDLLLPFALLAAVGTMVLPLPAALLDILLVFSLAMSFALLLSAVYVRHPEKFTALPSLLLLSTVFRLSLNISTTRQILATGEAPEIVSAFGGIVISENLVVGCVVFLIVTIVQFIVIAKGAERVAEVAARFTLDAMPGRQMSIDADLRAGLIGPAEARTRRGELQRESKLFGALDGAMKFVKGDAIAGIIIVLINIIAGLIVGTRMHELSLYEAVQRYSLFTIGDGLVSQIPALCVSVAAAIVITRVSDESGMFLGRDVLRQLSAEPQGLAAVGALLLAFAFVPGIPAFPCVGFSLVVFLSALAQWGGELRRTRQGRCESFHPRILSPLRIDVSKEVSTAILSSGRLLGALSQFRSVTFQSRGIFLPEPQIELAATLPVRHFAISLHGVNAEVGEIPRDTIDSAAEHIVVSLERYIGANLESLLNDTHTRTLLEVYEPVAEDLINSLIPNKLAITDLTVILRKLVAEGVEIKEMPLILQALAETPMTAGAAELSKTAVFAERMFAVRKALWRSIRASCRVGGTVVDAWVLSPKLDQLLNRIARANMALEGSFYEKLGQLLGDLARLEGKAPSANDGRPIVIATSYARHLLSELFNGPSINCHYLCPEELGPDMKLNVLGIIGESPSSPEEFSYDASSDVDAA